MKKDLAVGGDEDVDFAQFNTNITCLITPDKRGRGARECGCGARKRKARKPAPELCARSRAPRARAPRAPALNVRGARERGRRSTGGAWGAGHRAYTRGARERERRARV